MKPLKYPKLSFEKARTGVHTFFILKLYQESLINTCKNKIFYEVKKLGDSLSRPDQAWIIMLEDDNPVGFLQVLYDPIHSLAKSATLRTNQNQNSERFLEATRNLLKGFLANLHLFDIDTLEVMYITTSSLTLPQIHAAQSLDFVPVGSFPGCITQDVSKINGISAYYKKGVLKEQRYHKFTLHPAAQDLFELVHESIELESPLFLTDQTRSKNNEILNQELKCPRLEIIGAPEYVKNLFEVSKQNSPALTSSFYPFHVPNVLICDAKQQVNVFVLLNKKDKFATIIGEKFTNNFSLTDVYLTITDMLYKQGAQFIELVNDAADKDAIESALLAGFVPCCYFPGLKKVGNSRRDTIVQARSFERGFLVTENLFPKFQKFSQCFEKVQLAWVRLQPLGWEEVAKMGGMES